MYPHQEKNIYEKEEDESSMWEYVIIQGVFPTRDFSWVQKVIPDIVSTPLKLQIDL